MISILRLNGEVLVLENVPVVGTPGLFDARIVVRTSIAAAPKRQQSQTYGRRSIDYALSRLSRIKPGSRTHQLCLAYERQIQANPPVGEICHATTTEFLQQSGDKSFTGGSIHYTLIAWAVTRTPLTLSEDLPLRYRLGAGS